VAGTKEEIVLVELHSESGVRKYRRERSEDAALYLYDKRGDLITRVGYARRTTEAKQLHNI
jgi:hypothetical protein